MSKLIVHEFVSLDGVMQAPGGEDEDLDGGFTHGGWTRSFWHDDIGKTFVSVMQNVGAFLLGRKTYVTHGNAFEPMPAGDFFGDLMNKPRKYVVSRTLKEPVWRDTTIIRDNVIEEVRKLKAEVQGDILLDGSSQLLHELFKHDLVDELYLTVYPISLGGGKKVFPEGSTVTLRLVSSQAYPNGVVSLHYAR